MAEKALKITPQAWTVAAAAALAPAMGPDALAIQAEVEAGDAQLWKVENCGYVVTRFEIRGRENELVMVAGAGREYRRVLAMFERIGHANHAATIRVHCWRKGIKRWLKNAGYQEAAGSDAIDAIFIKDLKPWAGNQKAQAQASRTTQQTI
jgi:hypothetical protein